VAEDAALGDRASMAWSGTLVTYGQGTGVVTATGSATELGRISTLLATVEKLTTPLLKLMARFGQWLAGVILLELDRVGTSAGLDRAFLEKAVSVSDHALILGGGVKGIEDLQVLEDLGFRGALVATAVHNGRIPLEMLR
jgi:uncharacterized protein related to proFAR isomerase